MDAPRLTTIVLASRDLRFRKKNGRDVIAWPPNAEVTLEVVVRGPKCSGDDPDMPVKCQKKDFDIDWLITDSDGRAYIPERVAKSASGAYGAWSVFTPATNCGPMTIDVVVGQKSSGVFLRALKVWELIK